MDPTQLVPTPDILPAPWWFFSTLSILTFTLHIILANILLGGGMIALWSHLRAAPSTHDHEMQRVLGRKLPLIMAFAINFGVPPLLFLQVMYGQFIYVSSVLMAIPFLSIFVLLILAYYGLYLYRYKFDQLGGARGWVIGISALLMAVVGFFYVNSLLLMIDPGAWPAYFQEAGGKIFHLQEPSMIPRFLHFLVSCVALGGLLLSLIGWWQGRKGDDGWEALSWRGLVIFGVATMAQFIVGGFYLAGLPDQILAKLFLEDKTAFPVFFVGIMAGLASIFFAFNRMPWHTAVCAFLTILLMVVFRNAVRAAYLKPYTRLHEPQVVTQAGAAILFVLALAAGIVVMVYLIRLMTKPVEES